MAVMGLAARPGRGVPAVHDDSPDAAEGQDSGGCGGPEPPPRGCSRHRPRNRRCEATYVVSSGVSFRCRQGVSFECRLTPERAAAGRPGGPGRGGRGAPAGAAGGADDLVARRGGGADGRRAHRPARARLTAPWFGCSSLPIESSPGTPATRTSGSSSCALEYVVTRRRPRMGPLPLHRKAPSRAV